jgi:hypothetical protein
MPAEWRPWIGKAALAAGGVLMLGCVTLGLPGMVLVELATGLRLAPKLHSDSLWPAALVITFLGFGPDRSGEPRPAGEQAAHRRLAARAGDGGFGACRDVPRLDRLAAAVGMRWFSERRLRRGRPCYERATLCAKHHSTPIFSPQSRRLRSRKRGRKPAANEAEGMVEGDRTLQYDN